MSTPMTPEQADTNAALDRLAAEEFLIQFFRFSHLPPLLQAVSEKFAALAVQVMDLPRNPERTVALRKLLESKDCAVRAALAK